MRSHRPPLLYGLLVFLLLSGCANPATMRTSNLESVRAGMTRDQILEIMGPPQRQETYGSTEFWIYSTDGTSNTALLDFTPIAIVEGRVTGAGRKLYDAVVQAHSQSRADR
jgi:outer membrane protein assembly factor BamE (lipoprotein component of BamABCDE complex)